MTSSASANTLGIDFGTSNSAAGILVNGAPFLIEIEPGHSTLPTSVFFDADGKRTVFGNAANVALIQGTEGRFMRSLKSVLGTSLMGETRRIMGHKLTFYDIVSRFLAEVKTRAEATCYQTFDHALSGRPVHFHSGDATRDAQALQDLTQCYHMAGFKEVRFMNEPEAAAAATGFGATAGTVSLIVDIGGGTSDLSVFRRQADGGIDILASHGVRIGGTNFDRNISIDHVMPLFGRGAQIRNEMGPGTLPAPNAIYQDLATWQKIPFLYTAETRRSVARLQRQAVEKKLFERLGAVLEHELGHDVAFAVETGKIETNKPDRQTATIALGAIEPKLSVDVSKDGITQSLAPHAQDIQACALETLAMANLPPEAIDDVIFVGGSSLMAIVVDSMQHLFPNAILQHSNPFTAVVDGLAIAASRPFEQHPT